MKRDGINPTPASRKIEEQLAALSNLSFATEAAVATGILQKCLASKVGLVVSRAAKKTAELARRELVPDLLGGYDRMFVNPEKTDPQCWGKNAIAEALVAMEYSGAAPFLRGATYIQMEPVWGGSEDTAPALRGICLLALAGCLEVPRLDLLRFYVDRLLDKDKTVRREVLRALEQMGGADCGLLLRLKARLGDKEPEVVGQALESLLHLEPEVGVPFAGEFLKSAGPEIQEEAALALGMARSLAAVRLLIETWGQSRDLMILRALGLSRLPEAFDLLIEVVSRGGTRERAAALEALKPYIDSGDLRNRVDLALEQARGSRD
jgi:hypothetical protein